MNKSNGKICGIENIEMWFCQTNRRRRFSCSKNNKHHAHQRRCIGNYLNSSLMRFQCTQNTNSKFNILHPDRWCVHSIKCGCQICASNIESKMFLIFLLDVDFGHVIQIIPTAFNWFKWNIYWLDHLHVSHQLVIAIESTIQYIQLCFLFGNSQMELLML